MCKHRFFFEPNCSNTIMLSLRRTLVRSALYSAKKPGIFVLFFAVALNAHAQNKDSTNTKKDSVNNNVARLRDVFVQSFSFNNYWKNSPASVAVIREQKLHSVSETSVLPVMNTIPGVRMEERSPGSYRLSVRGSLLRSPFGVRNIKVYWNDIPFTDAGGNTYLNLVDINQLSSIELAKGPASSMYGANTGGALFLKSDGIPFEYPHDNILKVGITGGSYGLFDEHVTWQHQKNNFFSNLSQSHVQSDGYRQQSALRRDAVKWDAHWHFSSREQLSAVLFYTDLHYKTPGGITQQQMDSLPTLARLPAGTIPGAVQQHAGIYNKTVFAGLSLYSAIAKNLNNYTSVLVNHTDYKNPFITNYEHRSELNFGGRSVFDFTGGNKQFRFHWLNGVEWLHNNSNINVYGNKAGVQDTVQYKDVLHATQYFIFSQLNFNVSNNWKFEAGVSANQQLLKYKRTTDPVYNTYTNQNTKMLLAPRVSALYNLSQTASLYAIVSKGFSPPTLAEVRPSTGKFYDLQPEYGWDFEAGLKGFLFKYKMMFDINAYSFDLKHAIVRKTDSTGADYYTNAGGTNQHGIEALLQYEAINNTKNFISKFTITNSFAYQPYTFKNYIIGANNYSANAVTGVPKTVNVTTLETTFKQYYYFNIILNATSKIALTDANDAYAKAYQLLQMKIGYKKNVMKVKKVISFGNYLYSTFSIDIFGGIDNVLNQTYSLGNDINAFGKRFFNPAPKRNYFIGCNVSF